MANPGNLNLNATLQTGNTGTIGTFPEIGIIETVVLAPKGTVIPVTSLTDQATFNAYVAAKLINDTYSSRWFAFMNLDKFTDETKKTASEDTGRLNLSIYSFPSKFSFRYMEGMGNFIESTAFNNCQGQYDCYFIDDFGNWHGCQDVAGGTNGLAAYSMMQFFIPNSMRRTTSTGNQYMIELSLADPTQSNGQFKLYQANSQANALVMLQNAKLTDISGIIAPAVPSTSMTIILKSGQDSYDLGKAYTSSLTAACFVAYNLTTGAAATIASITKGSTVVAGETYWWVKVVLSGAPTSGDIVRVSLAAPSVVNAIIPNFNCESLSLNNANGANCAIKTFA